MMPLSIEQKGGRLTESPEANPIGMSETTAF